MKTKILSSVLKLTASGTTSVNLLSKDSKVIVSDVRQNLNELHHQRLVGFNQGLITTTDEQRVRLALMAIHFGLDIESVCKNLTWKELEEMCIKAFEDSGFATKKYFRFKGSGKRYGIDVLGLKEPSVLSAGCKHWRRSWQRTATENFVQAQLVRTKIFFRKFQGIEEKTIPQ